MKLSEGVEWAAHACAVMAALPPERVIPAAALAAFHDLPAPYMSKHLQALARAGLVVSTRGAGGGYRLARGARDISLWDVAQAIEGPGRSFRCQEIRRKGPCPTPAADCTKPCAIAAVFWDAEEAYRDALQRISIADVTRRIALGMDDARRAQLAAWIETAQGGQRV